MHKGGTSLLFYIQQYSTRMAWLFPNLFNRQNRNILPMAC